MQKLSQSKLKLKLKEELQKCLILSESDRNFWLFQIDILPYESLLNVYKIVKTKNELMESYLQSALKENPGHDYSKEFQMEIRKVKTKAFSLEESTESENAEDLLKNNLSNF